MKLYIAGPLFTPGERDYLDTLADRLDAAGHECFVPHRETKEPLTAESIFATDSGGCTTVARSWPGSTAR